MEKEDNYKEASKKTIFTKFGEMDINEYVSEQGSYHELRVSGDYVHSKIYHKNPLKDQTHMLMSILSVVYDCKNILILGGGGGGQCLQLLSMLHSSKITAVDIDSSMIELANKFLGKQSRQVSMIEQDALDFLHNTDDIYDFIIIDLFEGPQTPLFMNNRDIYRLAFRRLSDKGILAFNTGLPGKPYLYGSYQDDPFLQLSTIIRSAGFPSLFYQDILEIAVIYSFKQKTSLDIFREMLMNAWCRYKDVDLKCSVGCLLLMAVEIIDTGKVCFNELPAQSLNQLNIHYKMQLTKRLMRWGINGCADVNEYININIKHYLISHKKDSEQIANLERKYYQDILDATNKYITITNEEIAKYIAISTYKPQKNISLNMAQRNIFLIWMAISYIKQDNAQEAFYYMNQAIELIMNTMNSMINGNEPSSSNQLSNESSALKNAEYINSIANTMEKIHSKIPSIDLDISEAATSVDFREENLNGVNLKRAVIYLLTNGCEWALGNGNGCTVCGHIVKQTRSANLVPTNMLISQFDKAFSPLDFKQTPILNLYNNGSFFNDNEIPKDARKHMLSRIATNNDIKMIVLESRPEFIKENVIDELRFVTKNQYTEIAIGLEVVDDLMRSVCLNKGYRLKTFENAVKTLKNANINNLKTRAYVMLKPPFLTEDEGIEEAVHTILYAFQVGCATVSLEPCTIQDYTLSQDLYHMGKYRPPWLWSIIEVLKRCASYGKVISSLFQFYPSSLIVPFNCDKCSTRVLDAITAYNRTLNINVLHGLYCSCKAQWDNEIHTYHAPFVQRVESILNEIESRNH